MSDPQKGLHGAGILRVRFTVRIRKAAENPVKACQKRVREKRVAFSESINAVFE
jgi:hypothetical protein